MELLVFADEQKKIEDRWNYHGIVIIPKHKANSLYERIMLFREKYDYYNELKFSNINKKGKGTIFDISKDLINLIHGEALSVEKPTLYFSMTGIDNTKLDYSCFGDDGSPKGKYSNIYNRFFRASLLGACNLFFNDEESIEISHVIHDNEGNLENHGYFSWHVISSITEENTKISFGSDRIIFVDSDHNKEEQQRKCSHMVQLVDLLLGSITHSIHCENSNNKGKNRVAEIIAPLVRELLKPPRKNEGYYYTFRRYTISHFPKHKLRNFDGIPVKGEYYALPEVKIFDKSSGQGNLFDL